MKDVLIPLGLFLFIILFAFALIHTARKQRKAKSRVFRDFAEKNGLRYLEEDDGKAQEFAQDFDGIGQFSSPSLGKVIPKDVVEGTLNGSEIILFRHSTRFSEGWAREWFVAGVKSEEIIAEQCAVQFCKRRSGKNTLYLRDPVVKEQKIGGFNMVVRAVGSSGAGKMLDDGVLNKLADIAGDLSFQPEIQIRRKRIMAYLAGRNETVGDVETLEMLLEFAKKIDNI